MLRKTSFMALACALAFAAPTGTAIALEYLDFAVDAPSPEKEETVKAALRAASNLRTAENEGRTDAQDLLAAALADYSALTLALYSEGYYGGVVSILIDGQEASQIPLLKVPQTINRCEIRVKSGPKFEFDRARIDPLAGGTDLPEDFAKDRTARSTVITEAADAAISGWRDKGFAKAHIEQDRAVADHARNKLSVEIDLDQGPLVSFGDLVITKPSAVREKALRRIAGFPTGERFSPAEVETVLARLRRTRAFSSVTLTEADTVDPDGSMDMKLAVTDQKPRRIGFGAEYSTQDGAALSAFWLHRNFYGGAERLRFDVSIKNISTVSSGIDYGVSGRLDVPAIYGADTHGFTLIALEHLDEPTFETDRAEVRFGFTRPLSEYLSIESGIGFVWSHTNDDLGEREFTLVTLPTTITWDKRNNSLNPRQGHYVALQLTPYAGLNGSQSGGRLYADARGYFGYGDGDPTVLATRLQLGSVVGSDIEGTPPEYLFHSGGGGTVRGQPYQSLNVDLGNGDETGGRSFAALSVELRQDLTENLGVVAFADAGYVGEGSQFDNNGEWHSGAGLGVRYQTGLGPIRFDVAGPTGGETSDGVQFYIGIGQAF